MEIAIQAVAAKEADLWEYGRVSIAFEMRQFFQCESVPWEPVPGGHVSGGLKLHLRDVPEPYVKDYDAYIGEGPASWRSRFDLSNWCVLTARASDRAGVRLIGGAVVAWNSEGVHMLEDRTDLAVLWDLRVQPKYRGKGVGRELFRAAEAWCRSRGCRFLKVETQNVNVPACRFYQRMGCELGAIHRFAYPDLPEEVQLLWYKRLDGAAPC